MKILKTEEIDHEKLNALFKRRGGKITIPLFTKRVVDILETSDKEFEVHQCRCGEVMIFRTEYADYLRQKLNTEDIPCSSCLGLSDLNIPGQIFVILSNILEIMERRKIDKNQQQIYYTDKDFEQLRREGRGLFATKSVDEFYFGFRNFTNVFFDYALIFGNFGFAEYGIAGAAIASVIAEIIACIFFIFYTIKFIDTKYFGLFKFKRFNFALLKRILTVALPMMMQNFISFTGWFFFFLFVEKMGEHSLAISNVIRSIYVVMLIPIWGFTSATNTLVSFLIGRERTREVIPVVIKILKLCILGVMGLVLINLTIPEKVLSGCGNTT